MSHNRSSNFLNNINNCGGLSDLGCNSPRLTWSHNRERLANTLVCLDRALTNSSWCLKYPKASILNLPRTYSDHCPMIVQTEGMYTTHRNHVNKPFRFLMSWFNHPEFNKVVEDHWCNTEDLYTNLTNYTVKVKDWNKNVFENIFAHKKNLKARLKGIQIAQEKGFSYNLDRVERTLKLELQNVLKQDETLWAQKSRVQWLALGDRNTIFFHISTIIKRKRNCIEKLKIEGDWTNDSHIIADHINCYYNDLFSKDANGDLDDLDFPPAPIISDRDNIILKSPLTWSEVRFAIFSMQPMKAPGSYGYQPEFFQKNWDKVGISVFNFLKSCLVNWNFPEELNKCFITFIPKIDNPEC